MFDVAVVGAGPVGMLMAYALNARGLRVALFEAYREVPTENRAATIHSSTLSLLDEAKLGDEVIRLGLRADLFQWRDFESGKVIAEYDFGLLKDECAHPYAVQLEQHKLVNLIEAKLQTGSSVTYYRSTKVERIADHGDQVIISALSDEGPVECAARYLVGCDGARSIVRKSMGVEYAGYTFGEKFGVITVQHDFMASMGCRVRNYLSATDCWFGIFKVPGEDGKGIWRTTYPLAEDLSLDRKLAEAEVTRIYQRYLPTAVGAPITQLNTYNVHQRVATRFNVGRCVLAGDSAHINNPLGGLGLNSGIHDALILADKLQKLIQDGADIGLLDQYDRQRREPAKQYVQAQSVQNKKVMEERSPKERAINMAGMRATIANRDAHLAFVRRASLWTMLNDSLKIT